ncbi:hypothetical protein FB45DRAFT_1010163 [Roridomyces roridus]|uniref:Uncharacterized protein n=1 Tax=Roridomyces roridus TaxID=1738132 RepID=A0AAD7B428_9AGAR|nr:hypothetical protein FB45DRAFT_1010163 [Roridomyces roridus]
MGEGLEGVVRDRPYRAGSGVANSASSELAASRSLVQVEKLAIGGREIQFGELTEAAVDSGWTSISSLLPDAIDWTGEWTSRARRSLPVFTLCYAGEPYPIKGGEFVFKGKTLVVSRLFGISVYRWQYSFLQKSGTRDGCVYSRSGEVKVVFVVFQFEEGQTRKREAVTWEPGARIYRCGSLWTWDEFGLGKSRSSLPCLVTDRKSRKKAFLASPAAQGPSPNRTGGVQGLKVHYLATILRQSDWPSLRAKTSSWLGGIGFNLRPNNNFFHLA